MGAGADEISSTRSASSPTPGAGSTRPEGTWADPDGADERKTPEQDVDPQRIGRFAVLRRLGSGGMGVVYSAYDEDLDRRLAIKVLGEHRTLDEDRARMMREAQALARLSDPNVVQVYEVGDHEGHVFLAMEFVRGKTLRTLARETPPPPLPMVMDAFLQAGRGLAAVHEAGLVHRDFKPDNAIIGDDGRVRVLDFGIARLAGGPDDAPAEPALPSTEPVKLDSKLTRTGQFMGTPAYTSPEQLRGLPVDARSDQFSFCVALYEGLYQTRPFGGKRLTDLIQNVLDGKLHQPAKGTLVPSWLRAVVLRGLALDPEQRWPSMRALLAALGRDPRRRLRRLLYGGAATVIVAGGGAAAAGLITTGPQPCTGAAARMARAWSPDRSTTIRAAMVATGVGRAGESWDAAARELDSYAARWQASFTDACTTNLRGEQSDRVLDLRMHCLEKRHRELDALVVALAQPGPQTPALAPQAVGELQAVDHCDDVDALGADEPPPADARIAAAVDTMRERIAAAEATHLTGRTDDARVLADTILEDVAAIEYDPVHIEALELSAQIHDRNGRYVAASRDYQAAFYRAQASGNDHHATQLAIVLVSLVGARLAQYDEAEPWIRQADALVRRSGDPPVDRARLLAATGSVRERQGALEPATEALESALQILEGLDDVRATASTHNGLGLLKDKMRKWDEAQAHFEAAEKGWGEAFGAHHPQVSDAINNMGVTYLHADRYDEARDAFERALAIRRDALGPENPRVAHLLNNLGTVAQKIQDFDTALKHFAKSLEILEAALGPNDPALPIVLNNVGDVELRRDDPDAARRAYRRALEIDEAALGREHPDLSFELTGLGQAAIAKGEFKAAMVPLRRALQLRQDGGFPPDRVGQTRRELVYALWGMGRHAEARSEATKAHDEYAAEPHHQQQLQQWLDDHPIPQRRPAPAPVTPG